MTLLSFRHAGLFALLISPSKCVYSNNNNNGNYRNMKANSFRHFAKDENFVIKRSRASFDPSTSALHIVSASRNLLPCTATIPRGGAVGIIRMVIRLKVGCYFAVWYVLNIVYNILNKQYLYTIPAPLSVGSLQFLIGSLTSILLWMTHLRSPPELTSRGKKQGAILGFYHMMGQELSMISLGAGTLSFTHIVKALEPFFSAVVSAVLFGKWMHPKVYGTLFPVVGGVSYACLKERSFSWLAFWTAMGSNLAFALRAVVSKLALDASEQELGKNLTPVNLFGIVTIYAFCQSIPLALLGEGLSFIDLWKVALETYSTYELVWGLFVSGLFHYLSNEVMYLALSNVHPVTLAVGSTMKRVFIVVASVIVFRNPITLQAAIGSAIGIGGVLWYSLTKQYYEDLESKKLDEEKMVTK